MHSSRFIFALVVCNLKYICAAPAAGSVENPFCNPFDTPPDTPPSPPSSPGIPSPPSSPEPVDLSAGLGIEFETNALTFKSVPNGNCNRDKYERRKGKTIGGEHDPDWKWWMSGDTTHNSWIEDTKQGILTAEYIMNGLELKLGRGQAVPAAQEMTASWHERQYYNRPGLQVTIRMSDDEDDGCNDWLVSDDSPQSRDGLFAMQVTVPMPLNAIDELFRLTKTRGANTLITGFGRKKEKMVWVNRKFFMGNPEGIDGSDAEVRGFFSLLLTYAKYAHTSNPNESVKMLSSFMPRTNFVAMYDIIRPKIPDADLYKLAQRLACWKNSMDTDENGDWEVDEDDNQGGEGTLSWCKEGVPTARMDKASFSIKDGNNAEHKVSVKEWIENIASGERDLLQEGDALVDKQIGALGDKMEWVLNTERNAPIFEFRDLGSTRADNFPGQVQAAENAAVDLHTRFRDA